MRPEQTRLVRESWPVFAIRADDLAQHFYARLFEIDPSAARLFAHVDMDAQRRKLTRTLAVVVYAIGDPDQLLPHIAALGKRHTSYGIEARHFETVGEALLDALAATGGRSFTPEVRGAWAEAYALIASVMERALIRAESPAPPSSPRVGGARG